MASIKKAFAQAYADMIRKNYQEIYVFVDIHSTVSYPSYKDADHSVNYYPLAKEALQLLSTKKDVILIMYSCTPMEVCTKQSKVFAEDDIFFKYINDNPEVTSADSTYGCYEHKPFFNVLLDDKAGFDPAVDWQEIIDFYEKGL